MIQGFSQIESNLKSFLERAKRVTLKVAASEWIRSVHKNFEAGGRPAWPPRKRISKRQRGTNILVISGHMKSVNTNIDEQAGRVYLIPSPKAKDYSQIHNEGGVINMPSRPVKFRKNKAGRTVFASSRHKRITKETQTKAYIIRIPKREFSNIPAEDFPRIASAVKQALNL